MTPLDKIPPLIPLPTRPLRKRKKSFEDEAMFDKFATLFNPPTPPASPTIPDLQPSTSNQQPDPIPSSHSDGEFGSFVSVPANQDPLTAFTPIEEQFATPSSSHTQTPSLDFFDKFAEDAKRASDKNKHELLDELLLSESDPSFWPEPKRQQPQLDLNLDFLTSEPKPMPSPPPLRRSQTSPSHTPSVSDATIAPPLTTGSIASSPPPPSASQPTSGLSSRPSSPRSQSYQALSNLSARWLSLKQPPAPLSPVRHDTLQSIFNPETPPISHGTPFASHSDIFIPPTGAPGFKGEDRQWDKGFSAELEQERATTPTDMGTVIEKKTGYVDLQGKREATVGVLDTKLANLLRPYLPALRRLPRTWSLLYSLDQHGISLNTLYARCELPKPTGQLLVMKDANDYLFGVFMGDGIRPSRGQGYYGSGESFMFKYTPATSQLKIFKWTGRNDYIALCEPEYVSFGGGDGHYGLYLDAGLIDGSSARCPTFGNEVLCAPGPVKAGTVEFECVGLEVWKIGT